MTTMLPGKTIGLLGGGQLARMFILAGRCLGYRFVVFEGAADCPAASVADRVIVADFSDFKALDAFAEAVDVVTLEFEGIPVETVEYLEKKTEVRPSARVLGICQNRKAEKSFLRSEGIPCASFEVVHSPATLRDALARIGTPSVLKTACWGYDGKGQMKISEAVESVEDLWQRFDAPEGVLEQWIPFKAECSVIVARKENGDAAFFPLAENQHHNHILDTTVVPARLPSKVESAAQAMALKLAELLNVIGLLTVEFFVTEGDELLVNEMAPRPHNSGHFTLDATVTSQFEQGLRAVCGLPLGSVEQTTPVAMLNLLGDLWQGDHPPAWDRLLSNPHCKLHLYDKTLAKAGRKMGHVNLLAEDADKALKEITRLKQSMTTEAQPSV